MVDYTAIKATSDTLKKLLKTEMESLSNGNITVGRPEDEGGTNNRVNLFLFQVVENKHLKNDDNSKLWLDLFYLLTPYDSDEAQAHAILGDAMRVFHDYSIIHPSLKLKSGNSEVEIIEEVLKNSLEKIKITPYPLTLEELSNIWNPLKGDFRLSVAYQVSVVQIDSKRQKRYPAPVRSRRFDVIPFRHPEITEIRPQRAAMEEAVTILTIYGRSFSSENTNVMIGKEECNIESMTDNKIKVEIPAVLPPGPQVVEVILKQSPDREFGFSSNQGVFILTPLIRDINPSGISGDRLLILPGVPNKTVEFSSWGADIDLEEAGLDNTISVDGMMTTDLSNFSGFTNNPAKIEVKIGDGDYQTIDILGKPSDLDSLRAALEAGIHLVDEESFTNTAVLRDDDKLLFLSGTEGSAIEMQPSPPDPAYSELDLGDATSISGCLSDNILGFDGFTNDPAKIKVKIDNKNGNLEISNDIYDIESFKEILQKKIREARANDDRFNNALVLRVDSNFVNIIGTKLCHLPRSEPVIHIGEKSVDLDELIDETVVRIKVSKLLALEEKLPERKCPMRIRVNDVESKGISTGEGRELMWYYDKLEQVFEDKIKSEEITVEVFKNE